MPLIFHFTQPESAEQFASYYGLRWRILRAPWDQPRGSERDEFEDIANHLMATDSAGRLVGVGRLHKNTDTEAQIRYLAIEVDCRGLGVGRAIVQQLESMACAQGTQRIVLNSRKDVVGFYERLGYRVVEAGLTLFGHVEHSKMEKVW